MSGSLEADQLHPLRGHPVGWWKWGQSPPMFPFSGLCNIWSHHHHPWRHPKDPAWESMTSKAQRKSSCLMGRSAAIGRKPEGEWRKGCTGFCSDGPGFLVVPIQSLDLRIVALQGQGWRRNFMSLHLERQHTSCAAQCKWLNCASVFSSVKWR